MVRDLCVLFVACISTAFAHATDFGAPPNVPFPIPDHYRFINDYDGAIRISTAVEITKRLEELERSNGTRIVFLSVPHVGDEGVDVYSGRVFQKWNIGNNGQDNGVLFLASEDGVVIRTGAGIAGAIPDVKIGRIFREIIEPRWKRGEQSEAIEAGIDEMIKAAKGEDTLPTFFDYSRPYVPTRPEHILIGLLVLVGVGYVAMMIRSHIKRKKKTQCGT